MKNRISAVVMGLVCFLALSGTCLAVELLTSDQAVKEMFPDADKVDTVKKVLDAKQLAGIKEKLGGTLVYKGSGKGNTWKPETEYTLYYGIKGGEKTGVAIMEEEPGKWGPVKYIVMLDPKTAKVKNMAVMSLSEKRGRPIATKNFLSQFNGKGDGVGLGKGITGVSGATISSECTCFSVNKVIAIYQELLK